MHCTLLVPDLLWPHGAAADVCRGLSLPMLETLLARAQAETHAGVPREAWLCQAFEVERQRDWPVAPLTRALAHSGDDDGYWLRADPVHLQLQRDRVVLIESGMLQIGPEEAAALTDALNAQFAVNGLRFEAPSPRRWYLRVPQPPAIRTRTLSEAAGRDVRESLPEGDDAGAWRQIVNEIQMLMHAHPCNEARAEAGLPAINSVWLWGGGVPTAVRGRAFRAVWSDDPLALALGALTDAHAEPLPADAGAWLAAAQGTHRDGCHLVVLEGCATTAPYGDAQGWRRALEALEAQWFAPLVQALRAGTLASLVLASPGPAASRRFALARSNLRRFWLRPQPLARYCP